MKYVLITATLLLLVAFTRAPNYEELFIAVSKVESNNNPNVVSFHKGKAYVGIVQIGPYALADLKQHYPKYTNLTLRDFKSVALSKQAFIDYLVIYHPSSNEQAARIWNGGPSGPSKSATATYWRKVRNEM